MARLEALSQTDEMSIKGYTLTAIQRLRTYDKLSDKEVYKLKLKYEKQVIDLFPTHSTHRPNRNEAH